jgi:hypothetical protein
MPLREGLRDIIRIGFDKNGEATYMIKWDIADISESKMDELCLQIPWALKEALCMWLEHGPSSKEKARKNAA